MTCPRLVDVFACARLRARDPLVESYAEKGLLLALRLVPPLPPNPSYEKSLARVERLVREGNVAEAVWLLSELWRRARLSRLAWFTSYVIASMLVTLALLSLGLYSFLLGVAILAGVAGWSATWRPRWCLDGLGGEEVCYSASGWQGELEA